MPNREDFPRGIPGTVREKVEGVLCDYFAGDSLSVDELERRLDQTHRASSLEELRQILEDLPGGDDRLDALIRSPTEDASPAGTSPAVSSTDLQRYSGSRSTNDLALAVLGGSARRGRWLPAARTTALTVCGGVELDFREAALPGGVTEIQAFALMGGVEVIVPPGTAVDARGFAVMGGFDHMDDSFERDADRPVLRIRGMAIMGAIEISVRRPGESARDAKKRTRRERRERRERRRSSDDRTLGR